MDLMTDNEWITVSEVSEKVNIPVETIRRYIRSHSIHLRVKKQGKKYLIHNDCITAIKQIRTFYDRGMNVDEVEQNLSDSGIPMTITIKNNNDESMTVHVADELKEIKQALREQKEFNKSLLEQMKQQQEYIKESLEKRDKLLMESLNNALETKKQIAMTQQKKQGFFSRLFSKS